jgi:hypothetical protein
VNDKEIINSLVSKIDIMDLREDIRNSLFIKIDSENKFDE